MSILNLALLPFVAFAVHRLWTYEDIFAWPRWVIGKTYLAKPLLCPVCVAFWVALGCSLVMPNAHHWLIQPLWWALGVYPFLWWLVVAYGGVGRGEPSVVGPRSTKPSGCSSCDKAKAAIQAEQRRAAAFKRRAVLVVSGPQRQRALVARNALLAAGWYVELLTPTAGGLDARIRRKLLETGNGILMIFDDKLSFDRDAMWRRLCEFPAWGVVYMSENGVFPKQFPGWIMSENGIPGERTLVSRSPKDIPGTLESIWDTAVSHERLPHAHDLS